MSRTRTLSAEPPALPLMEAHLAELREAEAAWPSSSTVRVGMWLAIAAITMLFLAFTSAYIVRHGIDPFWQTIRMPGILPANTVLLLVSSLCLEMARRSLDAKSWLAATLGAGLLFVAGQLVAWQQLGQAGLNFTSSAHASFFYTLTAVHGLHLAGGLAALGWVAYGGRARNRWLEPVALYWHFMAALWLYLLFLLFGVR